LSAIAELLVQFKYCMWWNALPLHVLRLQAEAAVLKTLISGGSRTKVMALGIGSGINAAEMRDMASSPEDKHVIRVRDFGDLTTVEEQLRHESCVGKNVHKPRTNSMSLVGGVAQW